MDTFLRDLLSQLVGLTEFDKLTGSSTPLVNAAFVTIFSETNTAEHTKIRALQITLSGDPVTTPIFRVRAVRTGGSLKKIFPFDPDAEVLSAVIRQLEDGIQIPRGFDWEIQVKAGVTGASNAILDFASRIQTLSYSNE